MYLPPEVVHIVLTEFYKESDKLGAFLSLRLVCKAWKRTVEHVLKRVPEPPRGYHNVATKAYESEDYFRDYCIPPHPMTLSNKFQTCKGLPLASAPHYGEFILHRLTLRSAIDQGIETRFDASENGVAAAIASRDYYVIANQNATIKLVEKQSQKLVRTIQTRTPSRVVDLKVLKLRRQEFLVWMEESEHARSLGIFELHQDQKN